MLTKKEIIEALATEPLKAGQWLSDCGTKNCAIGAIVRHHLNKPEIEIKDRLEFNGVCSRNLAFGPHCSGSSIGQINKILAGGQYFNALSVYFESLVYREAVITELHREKLISFVEQHFPEKMDVTLPTAI